MAAKEPLATVLHDLFYFTIAHFLTKIFIFMALFIYGVQLIEGCRATSKRATLKEITQIWIIFSKDIYLYMQGLF